MLPLLVIAACSAGLAIGMISVGSLLGPVRRTSVKDMPYESGMDPVHEAHRRFDFRFHLVAIAFLIFDVELLFMYPWAVASGRRGAAEGLNAAVASGWVASRDVVFLGIALFFILLVVGFVYDWRKGIFQWR